MVTRHASTVVHVENNDRALSAFNPSRARLLTVAWPRRGAFGRGVWWRQCGPFRPLIGRSGRVFQQTLSLPQRAFSVFGHDEDLKYRQSYSGLVGVAGAIHVDVLKNIQRLLRQV